MKNHLGERASEWKSEKPFGSYIELCSARSYRGYFPMCIIYNFKFKLVP